MFTRALEQSLPEPLAASTEVIDQLQQVSWELTDPSLRRALLSAASHLQWQQLLEHQPPAPPAD